MYDGLLLSIPVVLVLVLLLGSVGCAPDTDDPPWEVHVMVHTPVAVDPELYGYQWRLDPTYGEPDTGSDEEQDPGFSVRSRRAGHWTIECMIWTTEDGSPRPWTPGRWGFDLGTGLRSTVDPPVVDYGAREATVHFTAVPAEFLVRPGRPEA